MALGVNLAANQKNAQLVCENSGLKLLVKQALKGTGDPLLLKMVSSMRRHNIDASAVRCEHLSLRA